MKPLYRSLMAIGVAMGVIAASFTIGIGQRLITVQKNERLAARNNDLFNVYAKSDNNGLTDDDIINPETVDQIRDTLFEGFSASIESELVIARGKVKSRDEILASTVFATDWKLPEIYQIEMHKGHFISKEEYMQRSKVCVISGKLSGLLGGSVQTISIIGEEFQIIGVFSDIFALNNSSLSDRYEELAIFIPLSSMHLFGEKTDLLNKTPMSIRNIIVKADWHSKSEINRLVGQWNNNNLMPLLIVESIGESMVPDLFEIIPQLLAIFAVSLIVMVIAILNIVQIAAAYVADTRRELGLKIAVGASPKDIMEEITGNILKCCIEGGYVGIVLSGVLHSVLNKKIDLFVSAFNPLTALMGVLLSAIAGLAASIVPSYIAAKTDPIEALRKE